MKTLRLKTAGMPFQVDVRLEKVGQWRCGDVRDGVSFSSFNTQTGAFEGDFVVSLASLREMAAQLHEVAQKETRAPGPKPVMTNEEARARAIVECMRIVQAATSCAALDTTRTLLRVAEQMQALLPAGETRASNPKPKGEP